MNSDTFLTPAEVAELSGIKVGRRVAGRLVTREQLQVQWLRGAGIPFFENARGRPIIARAVIEGRRPADPGPRRGWHPRVVST